MNTKSRRRELQARRRTRRSLLIGAGAAAIAAAGGALLLRPGGAIATIPPPVPYATPTKGDPQAPVTIVEYGDFQCPSCGAFFRTVEPELVRQYVDTGKAKLQFKHFPWIGSESRRAAEAASCAFAQGRFWEYHDALYQSQRGENTGGFSDQNLKAVASGLGLDPAAFASCFDGGAYRAAVEADRQEVSRLGLTGTPTFLINGQRVVGAQSLATFKAVLDAKLRG